MPHLIRGSIVKLFGVSLLALGMLGAIFAIILPVQAQTPEPTPNPTQQTPSPVPNIWPTSSYAPGYLCPDWSQYPITITDYLSPEWLVMCAACLPGMATPTSQNSIPYTPIVTQIINTPVFTSTGTPGTPSPSLTPTVSPTPLITPTPMGNGFQVYATDFDFYSRPGGTYESYFSSQWFNTQQAVAITFLGTKTTATLKRMADQQSLPGSNIWGNTSGDWSGVEYCLSSDGVLSAPYNTADLVCAAVCPECTVITQNNTTYRLQNQTVGTFGRAGWSCYAAPADQSSCTADIQIWGYWQLPTPTPSPTPVITATLPGYIDCTLPELRDDTPVVTYDGSVYTRTTCYTIIPAIDLTLPGIADIMETQWQVQEVQFCIDWYTFPSITVLDTTLPIALILVPVVLFLLFLIKSL